MTALAGAAAGLGLAFAGMAWVGDLHAHARAFLVLFAGAALAYGLAAARVVRRPPAGRRALALILVTGAGFRALLLPAAPSLSSDVYRYLWDGRLALHGVSPYRYPPEAPELAGLREDVLFPRLNHRDWRTLYPPGAQLLFRALAWAAPRSVLAFKLVMVFFDALVAVLVLGWLRALGRPPAWVLLYAWHPLVVVELAGTGHLDAVPLAASAGALWAASRGREGAAGVLLGAGTLVKLYPGLLVAAVASRYPGRTLVGAGTVVAAGYLLARAEGAAVLGSLGRYVAEEEFNGPLRSLLEIGLAPLGAWGPLAARLAPLGALGALGLWLLARGRRLPVDRRALWLVGGYLVSVPSLFPWYALWIVPVLAVRPAWPWLGLSLAVASTYAVFAERVWRIPVWSRLLQAAPLALGLAVAARHAWRGRGSGARP